LTSLIFLSYNSYKDIKGGILVEAFIQLFNSLNNQSGLIHAYHKLFGGKRYKCEKLKIICDSNRLGIKVKGKELYIPRNEIKIHNHEKQNFKRFEEKGYFEFGGSTVVLLLNKNIKFDSDIIEANNLGYEVKVCAGESIGHIEE
jgi:hypothetical protein